MMEERRYDDTTRLTDRPDFAEMLKAVEDPLNRSVTLHKPGEIIEGPKGKKFKVMEDGHWERVDVFEDEQEA